MDFIHPRVEEPVFIKNTPTVLPARRWHIFAGMRVRRVTITGIQMEQCCETTTRVAADLGYAVDFVTEATMTFPIPNWTSRGRN